MNTLSVFRPTPKYLYSIIPQYDEQMIVSSSPDNWNHYDNYQYCYQYSFSSSPYQENKYNFISQTPCIENSPASSMTETHQTKRNETKLKEHKIQKQTHKPKYAEIKRKTKKFWTNEQKQFALEKSKTLGLSKTTKNLKKNYPLIFGDLSPSTLQYWMYKNKYDNQEKQ